LINRSDTDVLIEQVAGLAARMPGLVFRIRLHPTMAHPHHEGCHSIERIRRCLRGLALGNLLVSESSLEEDLAGSDLYLSEYSNVLIEAWKRGRLGMAANLTSRRSFMEDFAAMGFAHADSAEALEAMLATAVANPAAAVGRQARAVEEYNRQLTAFLR
jgi:hypothetical protein